MSSFRRLFLKTLLYLALTTFIFDFNFYRYGVDIRLGRFTHEIVAEFEKDVHQYIDNLKDYW